MLVGCEFDLAKLVRRARFCLLDAAFDESLMRAMRIRRSRDASVRCAVDDRSMCARRLRVRPMAPCLMRVRCVLDDGVMCGRCAFVARSMIARYALDVRAMRVRGLVAMLVRCTVEACSILGLMIV